MDEEQISVDKVTEVVETKPSKNSELSNESFNKAFTERARRLEEKQKKEMDALRAEVLSQVSQSKEVKPPMEWIAKEKTLTDRIAELESRELERIKEKHEVIKQKELSKALKEHGFSTDPDDQEALIEILSSKVIQDENGKVFFKGIDNQPEEVANFITKFKEKPIAKKFIPSISTPTKSVQTKIVQPKYEQFEKTNSKPNFSDLAKKQ